MDKNKIYLGDNREVLKQFPDNYFDTFLEDIPYGLIGNDIPINDIIKAFDEDRSYIKGRGFMSREWDGFILGTDFTKIRYQKLKPGGYCLMFCSPLTIGLIQLALWKAGFNMITTFVWMYGSDFNKSKHRVKEMTEFIIVAQKPIEKGLTIQQNIDKWGTGGFNLEEGRVKTKDNIARVDYGTGFWGCSKGQSLEKSKENSSKGRMPTNVILSHTEHCVLTGEKKVKNNSKTRLTKGGRSFNYGGGGGIEHKPFLSHGYGDKDGYEILEDWRCVDGCPVKGVGDSSGEKESSHSDYNWEESKQDNVVHYVKTNIKSGVHYGDKGTASKYFYNSKTSKNERHAGCDDLLWKINKQAPVGYTLTDKKLWLNLDEKIKRQGNIHPTVKPVNLGEIFGKLLTSKKDGHKPVICDGFCGSGSLLIGLMYSGLDYVGIELNPEYHLIANTRMEYAKELLKMNKKVNDVKVKLKKPTNDDWRF